MVLLSSKSDYKNPWANKININVFYGEIAQSKIELRFFFEKIN